MYAFDHLQLMSTNSPFIDELIICLCLQNPSEAQRKEHDKFDFEQHEVYAIDVLISTGEGQGKDRDAKITIYKKTDETYMLKVCQKMCHFSKINTCCII